MATLGSFGALIFQVSSSRVLTYSELEESVKGRWVNHEPINDVVLSEFLGPGQDESSLKVIFTPLLGVDPDASYKLLRELTRKGEYFPLILGGVPLSNNYWYIDAIGSVSNMFHPKSGKILWREVDVNFKEYN